MAVVPDDLIGIGAPRRHRHGDRPAGAQFGVGQNLERLGRLLLQKKGPDAVMLVVLAAALLFGLIGFAAHFLWIVAIIVMALGLGFAVADSRRNRIDIANETVGPVPISLRGWTLWLLDSGVRHDHALGGYNERRAECRRTCAALGIGSLREARPGDVDRLPPPLDRRLRHVLTENTRVDQMADALRRADLPEAGRLLDEGHASLRDDYEVSAPAVEAAVARLRAAGARGARMVGGGFGGSVLGLFAPGGRPPPGALPVHPAAGASVSVQQPTATGT